MTPTVCQLDEFFLTKLHLDFRPPEKGNAEVTQAGCTFDYAVATHHEEAHRYRLIFRVGCKEAAKDGTEVGNSVQAEIVGLFSFNPSDSKDKMDTLIRINGVSILYGILRGIVATTTGAFPGGKFLLPTVMPQEVVQMVEQAKAKPATPQPPRAKPARIAQAKAGK